jgi:hypothetical protein
MGEAAQALGVGHSIVFEGKTYTISPFNMDMAAMFEVWLEDEAYRKVEIRKPFLAPDEYERRHKQVGELVASMAFSFGSEGFQKAMESLPGKKQMFLYMLMPNHPDISKEFVDRMFNQNLNEIIARLMAMNTSPKDEAPEESPSP